MVSQYGEGYSTHPSQYMLHKFARHLSKSNDIEG
jgi:hypothetical protein